MSEFYGGDDNGYYDEDGDYYKYDTGGGTGTGGGGGYTISGYNPDGSPIYNTGSLFTATGTGSYDPFSGDPGGGGGMDYFLNPTGGRGSPSTGGGVINTGGGYTPTPSAGGSNVTNNTQNNTQNNSNSVSQSVGLPAVSPISSGVPQAQASSFKPIDIHQGALSAPPPMRPPDPPSLHSEKPPVDWSKVTFGPADSAPKQQGNPASRSTLGKIAGAAGAITGIGGAVNRYKGIYDSLKSHKVKTPEEINAEMYRNVYGA